VRLEASTKPHVHNLIHEFLINMAFTMVCPNFKKGLKMVSGPLGVKCISRDWLIKISIDARTHIRSCRINQTQFIFGLPCSSRVHLLVRSFEQTESFCILSFYYLIITSIVFRQILVVLGSFRQFWYRFRQLLLHWQWLTSCPNFGLTPKTPSPFLPISTSKTLFFPNCKFLFFSFFHFNY
jgi:hypothetical protein